LAQEESPVILKLVETTDFDCETDNQQVTTQLDDGRLQIKLRTPTYATTAFTNALTQLTVFTMLFNASISHSNEDNLTYFDLTFFTRIAPESLDNFTKGPLTLRPSLPVP
jgi:hypothetical protein